VVTLGDLKREGRRLEIGCLSCHFHDYVPVQRVRLPDDTPSPRAGDRMACPGCGRRNTEAGHPLWTRPDARQPGFGG
jgi:hypothetical protein